VKRSAVLPLLLMLAGCSILGGGNSGTGTPTASASASPSASPVLQGLWVLAPLGVHVRDQPNTNGKVVGTIVQGIRLTATEFKRQAPGWYLVDHEGLKGWIAVAVPDSNPPVPLLSTHPQLSYSSTAAGYYFLYPASWTVTDKGADVEADAPLPGTQGGPPLATPQTAPSGAANGPITSDRFLVHEAKNVDSVGNIPIHPGSLLDTTNIEVYGITVIKRAYQLTGGGIEIDIKLRMSADKAALLTFQGTSDKELDTFNELVYSFGVNLPGGATPSP
jgi:hypothetical protein